MSLTTRAVEAASLANRLQMDQSSQDLRQTLEQFKGRPVRIVYEDAQGQVKTHSRLVLTDVWSERGLEASKKLPYNNVVFSFGNGTQLALVAGPDRSLPSKLPGTRGRLMRVDT